MGTLVTNPTLVVLGILLVWSLCTAGIGTNRVDRTWEPARRFLCNRAIVSYLVLGAFANVSVAALTGYINPRDYVQDVVAAHQFLKHATMYPGNLPQMGAVELTVPLSGRQILQKIPFVRDEFSNAALTPAPANAHPPVMGIVVAPPVLLLGLRASFLFFVALSIVLLYMALAAILRELFPPLSALELCIVFGLAFGWNPVSASLREAQPGIILFALVTAGWLMLRANRPWLAGGAIGLAASLHVFPALLLLYFAIRKRSAFVSAVATIALLNVAAAALSIKGTFLEWLNTASMISRNFVPRIDNLSMPARISSLLADMGGGEHAQVVVAVTVLTISGALALFLRPWNRREVSLERMDIEYSVFVAAMLLATPVMWARYLPIMLLPLAVLIRNWRLRHPAWAVPGLLSATILMSFSTFQFLRLNYAVSGKLGIAGSMTGWLVMSMTSFSITAVLLWLRSSGETIKGSDLANMVGTAGRNHEPVVP
jgi:Glycosyltransferase family 87